MLEESQYIQQSIVPTMHFQDSLPRLPIPELDKTCDRYISALKPLIDESKLQNTVNIVEKFKNGEGKGKLGFCISVLFIPKNSLVNFQVINFYVFASSNLR